MDETHLPLSVNIGSLPEDTGILSEKAVGMPEKNVTLTAITTQLSEIIR